MSIRPAPHPPHRLRSDVHYHFLGIGGIGMSAIAEILHRRGIRVSGSDASDGAPLAALRASGIPVTLGHDSAALEGAGAVVFSAALGEEHPIWEAVARRGLPRLHRAEMLGALAAGHRTLAVAGTHGKTTTTAALGHVLAYCGLDPTVLVGGHVPLFDGRNWRLGRGDWLVCEADESDASFLHLEPEAILLTNVEADHLDFHGSFDNVRSAFAAFLGRLPSGGALAYCQDDAEAAALGGEAARGSGLRNAAYGTGPDAKVAVEQQPAAGGGASRLTLRRAEQAWELDTQMMGRHNALNLCGAFAMGNLLGLEEGPMLEGLAGFTGVLRRQQYIGSVEVPAAEAGKPGRLAIYDDYAHHPTEIQATLAAFRAVHGDAVSVVFQPHLYSRTQRFAREFARALRPAARVYVTEIYGAREAPRPGVSGSLIVEHLRGHPAAVFAPDWRSLTEKVRAGEVPPGVLLTLGAGDITGLGPLLLEALPLGERS